MYKKEGSGLIVTTKSGSVYILERVTNATLSQNFRNAVSYNLENAENSQVYMISQSRQFSGKITFEHPVIGVSLNKSFMNGGNLDFIITDDEMNGRFQFNHFRSAEIVHIRGFQQEKRHDIVQDKFSNLVGNTSQYSGQSRINNYPER